MIASIVKRNIYILEILFLLFCLLDNFRPKNKSITYILERAGLFKVQFEILWFGKPFILTDSILVYKPVLKKDFELVMDDIVLFPPGNIIFF